jgi:poly(3-hydroxybutyrate) depolymerase
MKSFILLSFTILLTYFPVLAQDTTKELIRSQGKDRAYYLFVPKSAKSAAPLIVLLHGSGRNGMSLVEKWTDLAKKEGIIIVGPDASNSQGWRIPEDGPDFIHELVEALKAKYSVNPRRVYLFGHSAGGGQALYLSLFESEYFAATAVHAGALRKQDSEFMDQAKRKIPILMFIGTNDAMVPLPAVRATRDALNEHGFNSLLTEMEGHTHWYYDRAGEINRNAWEFLKKYELPGEPKYQQLQFGR